MLVEAAEGCANTEVVQQFPRVARVLRQNAVRTPQDPYRPQRDILQIPCE